MKIKGLIFSQSPSLSQNLTDFLKGLNCALVGIFITLTLSFQASANDEKAIAELLDQPTSAALLGEVNYLIENLDENTPTDTRINLDAWKLQSLPDENLEESANFALEIYRKYERSDYTSETQYGRTIHEMVQAFAKTHQISLAYDIVQDLRESVYSKPSVYLDYVIDLCLMEIYIETFDYTRALEVEISMIENLNYSSIPIFEERKPSLLTEIAFLYNRLGNGEKALEYLDQVQEILDSDGYHPENLQKRIAAIKGNRGRAYLLLGRYTEAEMLGRDVLDAGKLSNSSYMMVLGYRLLGSAALNLGDYERAKIHLERGIALADNRNIATMQQYLYSDYALNLERLGSFQEALIWTRKQTELEIRAREESAQARSLLHAAENRALESHQEVLELTKENNIQREISNRDRKIRRLLTLALFSLVAFGVILTFSFLSLRKNKKKLVSQANALRDINGQLKSAALHDPLTGLPNRLFMGRYLNTQLELARENNEKLAVVHIDIDHFKAINDKFGHAAGDFMLVEVSKKMRAFGGTNKTFARIGGDEFLLIMTGLKTIGENQSEIERLIEFIKSPMNFEGITLQPSASMGVAYYPSHGAKSSELVVNADLALYEAKQIGRGCIQYFEPTMKETLQRRKLLEAELMSALEDGTIQPYFQPQVNISTHTVVGVEALVRWTHESFGPISPAEFLPVAESSGLMVRLGRFVMEKAIQEAASWHAQNISFGRLGLNASASELGESDFVDWVLETTKKHGLPRDMLSIEILETVMIKDERLDLMRTLKRLRREKIHVELDDFGTGYASLQQVKADEIDRLKIDRSFIESLNVENSKAVIVGSIVKMAQKLDIDVIAEGAETAAELEALLNLGCVTVQGFGVARPMPAKAAGAWIKLYAPKLNDMRNSSNQSDIINAA